MALTACSECGNQVSDKASKCPHCGASLKSHGCLIVIGVILIAVVAFYGISWLIEWRAAHSDTAAPPSAGLAGAISPSQELANAAVELDEGQYQYYSFQLKRDSRIHVKIAAAPKHVNVMLMTPSQAELFREASPSEVFYYSEVLHGDKVVRFDETEIVPEGEWVIVVFRPPENIWSPQSTVVDIMITVY